MENSRMQIRLDDLSSVAMQQFLTEHVQDMHHTAPREYCHALDFNELKAPNIQVWSQWLGEELVGCVALKRLDEEQAELKSMRIAAQHRGKGLAKALMEHVLQAAHAAGVHCIKLETGTQAFFAPARALYRRYGFVPCEAFADYQASEHNTFMCKKL